MQKLIHAANIEGSLGGFKNYLINGNFDFWQRGTSQTISKSTSYTADRWICAADVNNVTVSRQEFTPGQNIIPNEPISFLRYSRTNTSNTSWLTQKIEDVRTLAGKTVTFSLWLKADKNITIGVYCGQDFGNGGSPRVYGLGTLIANVTTSWQKFYYTCNIPSIAGKTIGINTYLEFSISLPSTVGNCTFDIAQVQLEEGSVATDYQAIPFDIEFLRCLRYYESVFFVVYANQNSSSGLTSFVAPLKALKRKTPTVNVVSSYFSNCSIRTGKPEIVSSSSVGGYVVATAVGAVDSSFTVSIDAEL